MIEILISLFEKILKEDKFILSKSHASFPLIIYLKIKGFIQLKTHLELDKKWYLLYHWKFRSWTSDFCWYGFRKKKIKEKRKDFVLVSDGECQEGTTWETLLIASKNKLDNLIILIDYNKIQALTTLDEGLHLII